MTSNMSDGQIRVL